MSTTERNALLDELIAEGEIDHDLLAHIAGALATNAPAPAIKQRLLARMAEGGRLHRFAERVAEMLYTDEATARRYLDAIDDDDSWEESPLPDVRLFHVSGGEQVSGAITGFVRIPAGGLFPEHDHTGNETVLVVQGRCLDTHDGRILGPGDMARMAPGLGAHQVEALPGPPLVYLAVVFEGITIGEQKFGPQVL